MSHQIGSNRLIYHIQNRYNATNKENSNYYDFYSEESPLIVIHQELNLRKNSSSPNRRIPAIYHQF